MAETLPSRTWPFDIDTNVFVGACLGQGAAADVIRGCLLGQVVPLMGAALLSEYEDVLGREALMAKSRLLAAERGELLDFSGPLRVDAGVLCVAP